MPLPDTAKAVRSLPPELRRTLAPLRKVPFGLGVGAVGGAVLFVLCASHAAVAPDGEGAKWLWLIGQNYLPGTAPTFAGSLLGLVWGFVAGFVVGWLTAFLRNSLITVWVFLVAARERLKASGSVLDDLS